MTPWGNLLNVKWSEHIALILAFTSAVLVGARLLAISGFKVQTVYALIAGNGSGGVLLGSLLDYGSIVISALGPALIFLIYGLYRMGSPVNPILVGLATASSVAAPFLTSPLVVAIFYLAPVCALATGFLIRRRAARSARMKKLSEAEASAQLLMAGQRAGRISMYVTAAMIGLTVASIALSGNPWLPRERIDIRGEQPVVGYIVSNENSEVTLLIDKPRVVRYIDESKLKAHQLCERKHPAWTNLFIARPLHLGGLTAEAGSYLPCPEIGPTPSKLPRRRGNA